MINERGDKIKPELFFGLIRAVGTDKAAFLSRLKYELSQVGYEVIEIKLSAPLDRYAQIPSKPAHLNLIKQMDAGDKVRSTAGNDAVSALSVDNIRKERSNFQPNKGRAYFLDPLKTPEEVEFFRQLYGRSFYAIGLYGGQNNRREKLIEKLTLERTETDIVSELINRDQDGGTKWGQNVSETFPIADVFINADNISEIHTHTERFVQLIFGNTFETPTKSEYCMFHAKAAALRSADLGRQVGAVIASADAEIIAIGTNEVPVKDSGQYWVDLDSGKSAELRKKDDPRDWARGIDWNDHKKKELLTDLLACLDEEDFMKWGKEKQRELVEKIFSKERPKSFKNAKFLDLIGFYRSVHAETAAIIDAARKGVSTRTHNMYVTAFPCHECARHIVDAGIDQVFYIEPYPKSLASVQYPESIMVSGEESYLGNRVLFQPFVGIAPRQYVALFTGLDRKDKSGKVIEWTPDKSRPRYFSEFKAYESLEEERFNSIVILLKTLEKEDGTQENSH